MFLKERNVKIITAVLILLFLVKTSLRFSQWLKVREEVMENIIVFAS